MRGAMAASIVSQITSGTPAELNSRVAAAACGIIAAALSLYVAPNVTGFCGALLAALVAAIAYRDGRDFIIPDLYSAAAFVLALAAASFSADEEAIAAIATAIIRGAVLALAFLALRFIYQRLRHRHGLGLGDVKLAGVAGAWLGWTMLPIALEIATLSALTAVLIHRLVTRQNLKASTRLPFGLFFAPSIWIGWFLQTVSPWPWP
jgi:leader peptidase (prepilin peptidase)/N-methyltransferase